MHAKTRILRSGARIVHEKGFNGTGLKEILDAAGVPKGSFYFYFKSKEDFGLQLIDHFADSFLARADECLQAEEGAFVEKLRRYFRWLSQSFEDAGFRGGCPFGNLSLEMGDRSHRFRERLQRVFEELKDKIARVLEAAQAAGEVGAELDARLAADFVLSAWEGTILQMKVAKSAAPGEAFEHMVFGRLLKGERPARKPAQRKQRVSIGTP